MVDLAAALARFNEWRSCLGEAGVVDEDSGLTTADLSAIAAHVRNTADMVVKVEGKAG